MTLFTSTRRSAVRATDCTAVAAVAVVAAAVSCAGTSPASVRLSDAVALSAPTSVGTAPMFAVSPAGTQAVAWVSAPNGGTDGRLYVSVSAPPLPSFATAWAPSRHTARRHPSWRSHRMARCIAVYNVGRVVAGERFPRSALRLVSSRDDGRTWTPPVTVTDGPAFGSHGFHALHVAGDGTVYVSWFGKSDGDIDRRRRWLE